MPWQGLKTQQDGHARAAQRHEHRHLAWVQRTLQRAISLPLPKYGIKRALHLRRGAEDDWEPHATVMAYAPQSQCLVALIEGTGLHAPTQNPDMAALAHMSAWDSEIVVLDLAAGGRMLRRLGDRQAECAPQSPAQPRSLGVDDTTSPMRCTAQGGLCNCSCRTAGWRLRQPGGDRVCAQRCFCYGMACTPALP